MSITGHTKRSLAAECMSNDMAFPALDTSYTPNGTIQCGLTKREYFASLAMQGFLANPNAGDDPFFTIAKNSVACADKLIAALTDDPRSPE